MRLPTKTFRMHSKWMAHSDIKYLNTPTDDWIKGLQAEWRGVKRRIWWCLVDDMLKERSLNWQQIYISIWWSWSCRVDNDWSFVIGRVFCVSIWMRQYTRPFTSHHTLHNNFPLMGLLARIFWDFMALVSLEISLRVTVISWEFHRCKSIKITQNHRKKVADGISVVFGYFIFRKCKRTKDKPGGRLSGDIWPISKLVVKLKPTQIVVLIEIFTIRKTNAFVPSVWLDGFYCSANSGNRSYFRTIVDKQRLFGSCCAMLSCRNTALTERFVRLNCVDYRNGGPFKENLWSKPLQIATISPFA